MITPPFPTDNVLPPCVILFNEFESCLIQFCHRRRRLGGPEAERVSIPHELRVICLNEYAATRYYQACFVVFESDSNNTV